MAAAAVTVVSKIISFGLSSAASKKRRRAARAGREITRIRNFQARRGFIRKFRTLQAEQLLEGTREGGLESSRFQGAQAGLQTRGTQFLAENQDQLQLGRRINRNLEGAERDESTAAIFSGIADAAGSFV